eukprot:TRINITY_DN43177_c0_g3_i1.p1 TRINITY_DN43177_c0_g3~~TRINITY_DN43177_c0_g3_i1.p1  ORF type:complete len:471 (-),score=102.27 TRINITY_DN43177_c0_g3_i1:251-1663(-)
MHDMAEPPADPEAADAQSLAESIPEDLPPGACVMDTEDEAFGLPSRHDIEWLTRMVQEQQSVLLAHQQLLAECTEEFSALRDCLADAGAVSTERFLAQLHRRRFEAVRGEHAIASDIGLSSFLGVSELALPIGLLSGPAALEAAASSCRPMAASLRGVLAMVRQRTPPLFYVIGGGSLECPSTGVEVLNSGNGAWERLPPMSMRRWSPAAIVASGKLYVCGGGDGRDSLRCVEAFDFAAQRWVPQPNLLAERYGAYGGRLDGCLVVCGGEDSQEALRTVETLDPTKDFDSAAWVALPDMFEARASLAGGVVGRVLYVCGGLDEQDRPLSSVERFDPVVGSWGFAPAMNFPRASAAATSFRQALWVCGGKTGPDERVSSAECFDPQEGIWTLLTPMLSRRAGGAAAAARGRVYVFGGYDADSGVLRSAEVYDVEKALQETGGRWLGGGSWTLIESMHDKRWGCVAAVHTQL